MTRSNRRKSPTRSIIGAHFSSRARIHSAKAAEPDSHTLYNVIIDLCRVASAVPGAPGSVRECRTLGGQNFPGCTSLTFHTARALAEHPELYPDLHHRAAEIDEHQARADAFGDVANLCDSLARCARLHQVRHQSSAVSACKQVLDRVHLTGQHPELIPAIDPRLRRLWLLPAYRVLAEYLRSLTSWRKPAPKTRPSSPSRPRVIDQIRDVFADLLRAPKP